jgi:hypothetical protein
MSQPPPPPAVESTPKFSSKVKNMVRKMAPKIKKSSTNESKPEDRLSGQIDVEETEGMETFDPENSSFNLEKIDRKIFDKCDEINIEIEQFFKLSQNTIELAKKMKTNSSIIKSIGINNWRVKRKGNKLFQMHETLKANIDSITAELKVRTEQTLEEVSTLLVQSSHLKLRLCACIDYNTREVNEKQPVLIAARGLFSSVSNYEMYLRTMLRFYDEVSDQKAYEMPEYIPWALRAINQENDSNNNNKDSKKNAFDKEKAANRLQRVIDVS